LTAPTPKCHIVSPKMLLDNSASSNHLPFLFAFIYSVLQFFYTVFIVLRAAVRALVSLAVLLGFTCLVAFVYFVYFYEQISDDDCVKTKVNRGA